jgi:hypothetical protein
MRVTDFFPELLFPEDSRFTPQPPPDVDVCSGPVYTICVNDQWWAHISGQIMRLLRRDAWEGDDDQVSDAIQAIHKILDVGRPTMGCGCGSNGLPSRYSDDGVFQVSYDGGATWTDAPQFDPRNNVTLNPPLEGADGDDKKCKGAANIKRHMENQADKFIADGSAWGNVSDLISIAIAILIFVGIVGTGGALTPLLLALCGSLMAVGVTAFEAAMTPTVYATFQCIIYCNMQNDASFTDAQVTTIVNEIYGQLDGVAAEYLARTVEAMGASGLTNMARTASGEAADCSGCGCGGCVENFQTYFGIEASRTDTTITVTGVYVPQDGKYHAQIGTKPADGTPGSECCYITWNVTALNGSASWYCNDANPTLGGSCWTTPTWFLDYSLPTPFTKEFVVSSTPLPAPS